MDLPGQGRSLILASFGCCVHATAACLSAAESIALSRVLPGQSRLFLLEGLEHVNFAPRAGDYDTMLEAVRVLLAQRRH